MTMMILIIDIMQAQWDKIFTLDPRPCDGTILSYPILLLLNQQTGQDKARQQTVDKTTCFTG